MFKKMTGILEKYLGKVAYFLQTQIHFSSIVSGIVVIVPLTIIGGFATVITSAPALDAVKGGSLLYRIFAAWGNLASSGFGIFAKQIFNLTFGMLSVYVLIAITAALADKYKMNRVLNVITAVLVFIMVASPITTLEEKAAIPIAYLDAKGLFTAMIVACGTIEISRFLINKNIKFRLPSSVPPNVAAPFEQLIPMLINIVVFYALSILCQSATGVVIPQFILNIMKPLLSTTDTIWAAAIYALLLNGLWIVGVHGGNIVNSVMAPFFLINLTANAAARAAGEEMTSTLCTNWHLLGFNYGGSGVAMALVLAALLVAKSQHLRSITKLSLAPVAFNVSEPVVFGYPIVLNAYLALPFLLLGVFNSVVTYLCMSTGIVGKIFVAVPPNLPTPLILFLSTMDWKAPVLWLILLVIDAIVYIPFVKMFDGKLLKDEREAEMKKENEKVVA